MKKKLKFIAAAILVLSLIAFEFYAYAAPVDDMYLELEITYQELRHTERASKEFEQAYRDKVEAIAFMIYRPYAEAEDWENYFIQSKELIKTAYEFCDSIRDGLERDLIQKDRYPEYREQLAFVRDTIGDAYLWAGEPIFRLNLYQGIYEQTDTYIQNVVKMSEESSLLLGGLAGQYSEQALDALEDYNLHCRAKFILLATDTDLDLSALGHLYLEQMDIYSKALQLSAGSNI